MKQMAGTASWNSKWGPPLWRILHTCAERLGSNTNTFTAADEARAWVNVLTTLEYVIPCPVCRNHYHTWRLHNPAQELGKLRGPELREASRSWLWRLHDGVNRSNGVEGIPLEDIQGIYANRGTQEVQQDFTVLLNLLSEAMLHRLAEGTQVRIWKASFGLLRRLISV